MKKLLLLFALAMTGLLSTSVSSFAMTASVEKGESLVGKFQSRELKISAQKNSIKERVALRYFKKVVNKSQQEIEDIAAGRRGFNLFAFIIGFVFSWIGVLVILLVGGNVRSAVIGALISLLLWILLFAV